MTMKKIFTILGLYILLFISNQSCEPYHMLITDIRFESATLDRVTSNNQSKVYNDTSIFTKDIVFIISYYSGDVATINWGFSSNCYAYDRGRVYDNHLLDDTYSLKFDHPFTFNNDTIFAGTNIFSVESIKKEINIFKTYNTFHYMGADKVLEFTDYFVKNSKFIDDKYKVNFSCKTSDNKELNKEIFVEFKL
jgi:hypothetical protein